MDSRGRAAADIALACAVARCRAAGAAVTASVARRPRTLACVAARSSGAGEQVQAEGDIHAGDGAGEHDGN